MVFAVLAAADLYGTKLNYELDFPARPSLGEFEGKVAAVFGAEARLRRGDGGGAFDVYRMQVYNDTTEQWQPLTSAALLVEYCQVYVFQRAPQQHHEVQSKIPPAMRPPTVALPPPPPPPAPLPYAPYAPVPAAVGAFSHNKTPYSCTGLLTSPGAPTTSPPRIPKPPAPGTPERSPSIVPPAALAPPPPVVAALPTPGAVGADPAAASFDEKVAALYERLAPSGGSLEGFMHLFACVRVDLAAELLHDIFGKCDADADGILSAAEFRSFAGAYPTLLDSLWFRSYDAAIDTRQQETIAAAKKAVAVLCQCEADARVAVQHAEAEVVECGGRVAREAAALDAHAVQEEGVRASLDAARAEVTHAQQSLSTSRGGLAQAKRREEESQATLMTARHGVQAAEQRVRAVDHDVLSAEARLQELERLVAKQRDEVAQLHEVGQQSRAAWRHAEAEAARASEWLQDAESASTAAQAGAVHAEGTVATLQERERAVHQSLMAAGAAGAELRRACEEAERVKARAEARVGVLQKQEAEAAQARAAQEQHAQQLERENLELNVSRRQAEERERPLLEQEVRLRLQRHNLELEEARLRDEHRSFHTSHSQARLAYAAPWPVPDAPGRLP
eukprot:TRINITY_DN32844_c0_g1_i1.p1 TRINITY_DN32844_c0_g1~~TRINITY_DN32844_c0_g1_i1.p1  ORF type:complete len:651 (+),score=232.56 TRINITY_DN32844_c0_g1_i1:95-1954(+)